MQILGSAFTEGARAELPQYLAQFPPNFPIGWDDNPTALAYLQISILNPGYVPKMVFIDRAGMIRAQYSGEDSFFLDQDKSVRAKLDEMLKAPAATPASKKSASAKNKK